MTKISVGDAVRLKSGGPLMTVTDIDGPKGGISVVWFGGENFVRNEFGKDVIEIVPFPRNVGK